MSSDIPKTSAPRYAVERESEDDYRIVRDGAFVIARCKFVKDAELIVKALREYKP